MGTSTEEKGHIKGKTAIKQAAVRVGAPSVRLRALKAFGLWRTARVSTRWKAAVLTGYLPLQSPHHLP
ncbi:unnamed protein product [Enterobius vermicularis]|uniref:Transposase n=1 Tax=Enterobius vermicularis TaxID=51028 RepID=A0A0N4UVA6_ENTVE|nr:unnamed protein product [Enterobius vermicularis]